VGQDKPNGLESPFLSLNGGMQNETDPQSAVLAPHDLVFGTFDLRAGAL
jgi:hypothetical protein